MVLFWFFLIDLFFGGAGSSLLCAGSSVVVVFGLLTVAEHGLKSCGLRPSLLPGLWNLPGPGWKVCPCIGRWVLHHWTTREVPISLVFKLFSL